MDAMRRAKKDMRTLPLREGQPSVTFHYAVVLVRAAWLEWKANGRFPDSYGDLMDIDVHLRNDVMMYERAMQWAIAAERMFGEGD